MSTFRYPQTSVYQGCIIPAPDRLISILRYLKSTFIIIGNVVTIKLSENQENVLQTDGTYLTMIVETHFQMNYLTGEWKRIKKYRRLEEA